MELKRESFAVTILHNHDFHWWIFGKMSRLYFDITLWNKSNLCTVKSQFTDLKLRCKVMVIKR